MEHLTVLNTLLLAEANMKPAPGSKQADYAANVFYCKEFSVRTYDSYYPPA